MSLFINITLNGITNGMIFASLALALVLIFRATRIINFAQGAMAMMTTFIASSLLDQGLGYWWAFVAVLVIGFVFGGLVERVLIRPLQGKVRAQPGHRDHRPAGRARGYRRRHLRQLQPRLSRRRTPRAGSTVGHTKIAFSHFDVFILVAVLVLMGATLVLFRATSLGLRMRASAFAGEISRLLGVRVGLLLTLGWALAGVAGSLAGLLVAPTSSFGPYFMDLVLVYAFTAAVIGGLESPVGALIGGLITGTVHLLRRWLPGLGAAAAGGVGPADGRPHGPARGDLRPATGPAGVR